MDPYLISNKKKILDGLFNVKKGSHNKARKEYEWVWGEASLLVYFWNHGLGKDFQIMIQKEVFGRFGSLDVGRKISSNNILPDA